MAEDITPANYGALWLPGMGMMPVHVRQVEQRILEYDARLSLGRDKRNGDWVVLREGGPDDVPHFPVFGLGPELPSPDKVKEMLFERDVARNGTRIVEAVVKRQNERRAAAKQRADDATSEAAQGLAWAHRKMGDIRAPGKVFIPGRD